MHIQEINEVTKTDEPDFDLNMAFNDFKKIETSEKNRIKLQK